MPYKTGKMKGELTTPEIRKLIKAHNILVSIKIPKGAKREDIIALVEKNGYKVDHEKQALVPRVEMQRKKTIGLKKAEKVLPKPKSAEEKAAAKKVREIKKQEKETEAFKKREAQVKALGKVVARRKKGEIKKPSSVVPEFKTLKQLESFFMKALEKFRKEDVVKFINRLKGLNDIKQIQDERRALRQKGRKNVMDILDANEDLFDDDEDKYDELDNRFEKVFSVAFEKAGDRIKELKN